MVNAKKKREVLVIKLPARPINVLRHLVGIGLGVSIMLVAVRWEYHPLVGKEWEVVWGGFCWLLHGIGCVPICNHIDGLWKIFS